MRTEEQRKKQKEYKRKWRENHRARYRKQSREGAKKRRKKFHEKFIEQERGSRNRNKFGYNMFRVLKRDNYSCQACGITREEHIVKYGRDISLHHKDRNKQNNELDNLITICGSCHTKLHLSHKKLPDIRCKMCGKSFCTHHHRTKFCSMKCFADYRRDKAIQKVREKGDK